MLVVNPDFPANSVGELIQYAKAHPGTGQFRVGGQRDDLASRRRALPDDGRRRHRPHPLSRRRARGGGCHGRTGADDDRRDAERLSAGEKRQGCAASRARPRSAFRPRPSIRRSPSPACPATSVSAWDGDLRAGRNARPIIDRLNAAIRQALDDPQVRESLLAHGAQAVPGTPDGLARHVAEEAEKWAKVVRQSGAKID